MAGIFKAYDIRGIYSDTNDEGTLYPSIAWQIGYALGHNDVVFEKGPILISMDMRDSSPGLVAALATGLQDAGRQVLFGGMMSTPMHYWYNRHWNCGGSVQVTASHNPAQYNGFKVSGPGARPVGYDSGLQQIEAAVQQSAAGPETHTMPPIHEPEEALLDRYATAILQRFPVQKPWRICIDPGNGMAAFDSPTVLDRMAELQWQGICMELDGNFPNHEANPLDYKTLAMLQQKLRQGQFDLGVAFDGDGDRAIFLTGRGTIIRPDALTAFLAESLILEELATHPEAEPAAACDVRMSQYASKVVEAAGGRPLRGKVGHAFMKKLLRDENALFGGEVSCHFYYRDLGSTDSALYTLLAGLYFLAQRGITPEDLNERYAPWPKSEEINFRVGNARTVMDRVVAAYRDREPKAEVDTLDGVTVYLDGRWFNLRASNTEPVLRLNAELTSDTATAGDLQTFIDEVSQEVQKADT